MVDEMSRWERFRKLNPALLRGLFVSVIALAGSLGYAGITGNKADAIWGVIGAVLALVQATSTRDAVTPNAKVLAYINDPERPITTQIFAGEAVVPVGRAEEAAKAAALKGR